MASEIIEYRGYELHIEPYESGFKARLRKSGSLFDRPELPYSEKDAARANDRGGEGYRRHTALRFYTSRLGSILAVSHQSRNSLSAHCAGA